METLKEIFEFELFHFNEYSLTVFEIIGILVIFLVTKLILWLIRKAVFHKTKQKKLDRGSSFALLQLIKYIIWVIAAASMLELIGVKVTLLIAGSAALLVGVGLGLQQTFNDILSGIILLFEQSVKVDDVLEIDGDIVVIKEIGLRASKGINRRQIIIIIPNSLITTSKVINWSHQAEKTLFSIKVGVAYGSDIELVTKVLEESAASHPEVTKQDVLEARFTDFGNSSLDFELLFYSNNRFYIEKIKSDIRKIINKKFIENNITVPFPQMDLHLKSKPE